MAFPSEFRVCTMYSVEIASRSPMPDAFTLIWNRLEKTGKYDLEYRTLGAKSVGLPQYTKNCYELIKDMADLIDDPLFNQEAIAR